MSFIEVKCAFVPKTIRTALCEEAIDRGWGEVEVRTANSDPGEGDAVAHVVKLTVRDFGELNPRKMTSLATLRQPVLDKPFFVYLDVYGKRGKFALFEVVGPDLQLVPIYPPAA